MSLRIASSLLVLLLLAVCSPSPTAHAADVRRTPAGASVVVGELTQIGDRSITVFAELGDGKPAESRVYRIENPLRVICDPPPGGSGEDGRRAVARAAAVHRSYLTPGQTVRVALRGDRATEIRIKAPRPVPGTLEAADASGLALRPDAGGAERATFELDDRTEVLRLFVRETRAEGGQTVRTYRAEIASRADLKVDQSLIVFPSGKAADAASPRAAKVMIVTPDAATRPAE